MNVTPVSLGRARWVVGALTAVLLVWALVLYSVGEAGATFSNLGEAAVSLLAATACALAAWSSRGRLRSAWAALAAASLSWGVGQVIWTWYELFQGRPTPTPGVADVFFLGFPLGAVIALIIFPSAVTRTGRWRVALDGAITACAIGLVSWATALGAVVRAGGDGRLELIVSAAYPATDIVLLVLCVLVMSQTRAHRVTLGVIAAGLALMAFADSGFAYLMAVNSYATDSAVDLGWFLAFGLVTFATLTRRATGDSPLRELPMVAGAAMPYVILGVALGFLPLQKATTDAVPAAERALFVVLVVLVLVRQFLTEPVS